MTKEQRNNELISEYSDFINQLIFQYIDLEEYYFPIRIKAERALIKARNEYKEEYLKEGIDFEGYSKLWIEKAIENELKNRGITPKFIHAN